jgi:hypothetical protein
LSPRRNTARSALLSHWNEMEAFSSHLSDCNLHPFLSHRNLEHSGTLFGRITQKMATGYPLPASRQGNSFVFPYSYTC